MAHLMLMQDLKESVQHEAMQCALSGREAPDLGVAMANLDALINSPTSLIKQKVAETPLTEEEQRFEEKAALLRSALGLPPEAR